MKKIRIGATILLLTLALTGCSQIHFGKDAVTIGNIQKDKPKKSKKKKIKQVRKTPKKIKKPVVEDFWNESKDKKLQKAVNNWGKAARQHYQFYDGTHLLKTKAGVTYPSAFTQNKFVLKKKQIKLGWSHSGENKYQYNVVAIANDNFATWHNTYLFCLKDKKPVILLDQSKKNKIVEVEKVNKNNLNVNCNNKLNIYTA
mgnify:CR=1 FL=1